MEAVPERRTLASTAQGLAAVILGNDAVVSARPSTPAQLANACTAAGFDLVVPPSWGDEIVAMTYLEQLAGRDEHVIVSCACPRVAALLARAPSHTPTVSLAAPAVAVARALRRIHGDAILITYVGDCPSATDSSIDLRFSPAALFAQLERQGVAIVEQPNEFDSRDADRWRRHTSVPGGLPALRFLGRPPVDRVLRVVDAAAFTNGAIPKSRANILVDLAGAAECVCGGDRDRIEEGEPARSLVPVLRPPSDLVLGPDPTPARTRAVSLRGPTRQASPPSEAAERVPPPAPALPVTAAVVSARAAAVQPMTVEHAPKPVVRRAAGRGARRSVLLAVPAVVLVAAAALGVVVYRGGAVSALGGADTAASRNTPSADMPALGSATRRSTPQSQARSADAVAAPRESSRSTPPVARESVGVQVAPRNQGSSDGRRGTLGDSSLADSVARAPATRRRAPRPTAVVPGWLPQGQPAFSPTDTTARRPDSSANRAPRDTTPPA